MQVIFIVSYKVKPEAKKDYLKTVNLLRNKMQEIGKNYEIYENKNKDTYYEIYFCETFEEYDSLDENLPENIQFLIDSLRHYIDGEISYQTLYQLE